MRLKKFESFNDSYKRLNDIRLESAKKRKEEILNKVWHNSYVGDVLPEHEIYNYVEELHDSYDFTDGDLGERVERYDKYQLKEIDINKIDIEEFDSDYEKVEDYAHKIENNTYPPIVLNDDLTIIDGTHRTLALISLGYDKVLAWVGI